LDEIDGQVASAHAVRRSTGRVSPWRDSTFDIAGPDVLSYGDMMRRFARAAGLRRRLIIPVPLLSPWLSSH
jgi:uncharacterized protein YbjT (DUF2867 family)